MLLGYAQENLKSLDERCQSIRNPIFAGYCRTGVLTLYEAGVSPSALKPAMINRQERISK
jgi:hypothetical protein